MARSEDALISDGNTRRVLSADELRREALCWRCRGFGHLRENCPSSDVIRPIGACIEIDQLELRGSARRFTPFGKGKGKGGGRGKGAGRGGGGGRGRFRPAGGLFVDEDGMLYSYNGMSLDGAVRAGSAACGETARDISVCGRSLKKTTIQ